MVWKPVCIPNDKEASSFRHEFGKKAKFLVDENLGKDVAKLLRRSGWNTKYVDEVGLTGRDDKEVLAFAQRDDRVLLTYDRDFLDNRKYPEHRNPGIVILPGAEGKHCLSQEYPILVASGRTGMHQTAVHLIE